MNGRMLILISSIIIILIIFGLKNESDELSGYQLVWSDEFNNSSLDATKWIATNNDKDRSANIHISDSNLVLTGTKDIDGKVYGADVQSRDKFHFRYGYIEYRTKLTNNIGFKSSLWFNGVYNWPPEIDVIETGSKQTIHMTRHCRLDSVYSDCYGIYKYIDDKRVDIYKRFSWDANFDKSKDYHIYGVEWTPIYVRWIIDGIERYRVTTGVPKEDMYIHASICARTDIRECWPETVIASEFPTSIYVDYIRMYKRI